MAVCAGFALWLIPIFVINAPAAYLNDRVPPRVTFLPGPISRYRSAHHDDDDDGAEEDAR